MSRRREWQLQWVQKGFNTQQLKDTALQLHLSNIFLSKNDLHYLFVLHTSTNEVQCFAHEETVTYIGKVGGQFYNNFENTQHVITNMHKLDHIVGTLELYLLTQPICVPTTCPPLSLPIKNPLPLVDREMIQMKGYGKPKDTITGYDLLGYIRLLSRFKWMQRYSPTTILQDNAHYVGKVPGIGILPKISVFPYEGVLPKLPKNLSPKGQPLNMKYNMQGVVVNTTDYEDHPKLIYIDEYRKQIQGKILIVRNCRPELVEYFQDIIAFISDEGGVTSHAAQIAREKGLPCIIGAAGATKKFKTGDKIVLKTNGRITKCRD